MYYIGIDLGTSAVKLLLMDGGGKIVNIVSREYPLYFPHPGWSEQKPEDWYEQSMAGIKDALGVVGRHAHQAVHAVLALEVAVGKVALDIDCGRFDAGLVAFEQVGD